MQHPVTAIGLRVLFVIVMPIHAAIAGRVLGGVQMVMGEAGSEKAGDEGHQGRMGEEGPVPGEIQQTTGSLGLISGRRTIVIIDSAAVPSVDFIT